MWLDAAALFGLFLLVSQTLSSVSSMIWVLQNGLALVAVILLVRFFI